MKDKRSCTYVRPLILRGFQSGAMNINDGAMDFTSEAMGFDGETVHLEDGTVHWFRRDLIQM